MNRNLYTGKFFVLEGLDGSGQSTQAELLKSFLEEKGFTVILTKEPTIESEAGRKIRRILKKEISVGSEDLQILFVQDRKKHLENLVIPSLKDGKIVISDRYFFSTIAFGGIDLDMEKLISLNQDFLYPDITFFLDVPAEVCIERIGQRGGKFEHFERLEKLEKVRKNYYLLWKRFREFFRINGESSPEKVFSEVESILKQMNHI